MDNSTILEQGLRFGWLRSRFVRNGLLGVGVAVLAMGGRAALTPWLGNELLSFVFVWPALAFVALYKGCFPATIIVLVSLIWTWLPWLPPTLSYEAALIQTVVLLPSALFMSLVLPRVAKEMNAFKKAPKAEPNSVTRWLRKSMIAAIVLPAAFFVVAAWVSYKESFENATTLLEQTARTVEEHASKVFESNELVLRQLNLVLGSRGAESWRSSEIFLHEQLKELNKGLPQVRGIWVWDEFGAPVASSRRFPVPTNLQVLDRKYFQVQKEKDAGFYISEVVRTKETKAEVFTISKRWNLPGHEFGGVLALALPTSYFANFYRDLEKISPGLVVTLVREDGVVLARQPPVSPDARVSPQSLLMNSIGAGELSGTFFNDSGLDPYIKLVSYRKVGSHPVYAVAGLGRETILSSWYQHLAILAAFTFPTAFGLAYVSWVALRRVASEQAAQEGEQAATEARQRAENALHEARRLEALGRLTGGVAHDFNNLLAVISNNLYLHKRLVPTSADSPQLAAILRAADNGAKLTRQLLAFSRQQALLPEVISLQQQLPELLPLLQATLGRQVEITLDINPAVPPVKADRSELELGLLNLAINAKDAMPQGGILRLQATLAQPPIGSTGSGPWACITVSDTGHGIPPDILSKVFEPFFTTKEQGKGTGLGLSQLYGFVTQAGEQLSIASEVGVSTTVTILLPGSQEEASATRPGSTEGAFRLEARILLVEDNSEVAATTQALLNAAGCEVHHVGDGDAARSYLEAAGRDTIDLVLTDIIMPGKTNGVALALWAKEFLPHMPILLMTGYSRETAVAAKQGWSVLQKPVNPEALISAVRQHLEKPLLS